MISLIGSLFTLIGIVAITYMLVKFGIWIGKNYVRLKKRIHQYTKEEM